MGRLLVSVVTATIAVLGTWSTDAHADDPAPAPAPASTPPVTGQIDLERDTKPPAAEPIEPPPEAPPPLPYKNTVVLDSSLGVMAFLGEFGKVAPPGPWFHTQLGYEFFKWLMLFGEGELAFTSTSNREDPPRTRSFPIFGFGGGVRFTVRFTDRVGAYAQGSVGMMKADVANNALGNLGFRDVESLDVYFGGRLGVEWYQIDRHFGLGLNFGARSAQGFAKSVGSSGSPLIGDAGVALRYAF